MQLHSSLEDDTAVVNAQFGFLVSDLLGILGASPSRISIWAMHKDKEDHIAKVSWTKGYSRDNIPVNAYQLLIRYILFIIEENGKLLIWNITFGVNRLGV